MREWWICFVVCLGLLLSSFRASAEAMPDYDALVHQGNAQLQAGNNEQALTTASSAIKLNGDRWEAHALAGGALMNLKRYEEAADQFGHAIDRAPQEKQTGLRDLRKQCILAESGAAATGSATARAPEQSAAATTQGEIVLWKSIENSSNPADFQTYLAQYPHGAFASLANRHLNEAREAEARAEANQRLLATSWIDTTSGLMWARQDNGSQITWSQARDYCENLRTLDHSDWRLPSVSEVNAIYDSRRLDHNRGGLRLTWIPSKHGGPARVWLWTSEEVGPGKAKLVAFHSNNTYQEKKDNAIADALCVRAVTPEIGGHDTYFPSQQP
jgi:tetratricopeptide (TPR) repeat protein